MTDQHSDTSHRPQPAAGAEASSRPQTPEAVLSALTPREPAERRRAFSALLRSLVDERDTSGGAV